jgi:hypothetical protein
MMRPVNDCVLRADNVATLATESNLTMAFYLCLLRLRCEQRRITWTDPPTINTKDWPRIEATDDAMYGSSTSKLKWPDAMAHGPCEIRGHSNGFLDAKSNDEDR